MDFLDRLKDKLESYAFTPQKIDIGVYQQDGNSLAIRPSPSSIDERYMERGKIYPYSFQILSHNRNNHVAYETIQELVSRLDGMDARAITSDDGSFVLVSMQCTTTPNFVQKTSYGVLWTCIFEAELYIGGKQ